MGNVKRIYVEKKAPYAVRAKELKGELLSYLGLKSLKEVRVRSSVSFRSLTHCSAESALWSNCPGRYSTEILKPCDDF